MTRQDFLQKYSDPIKVLDHGFVRLVDVMGNDASIVQAARVSYGKGTKTLHKDRGLIRYLMRHEHMSPFEMCEIKFHIKVPIFVHRQIVRHRTANRNEYSMRYSKAIEDYYIPDYNRMNVQDRKNHQSSDEQSVIDGADVLSGLMDTIAEESFKVYTVLINSGLAREVSRTVLPLSMYTEEYWKMDLRNLLHFLHLRLDSHAQYEIRQFAKAVAQIVKAWVPVTWEAFEDYVLNAVTFSAPELECLRISLTNNALDSLSESEIAELRAKVRSIQK